MLAVARALKAPSGRPANAIIRCATKTVCGVCQDELTRLPPPVYTRRSRGWRNVISPAPLPGAPARRARAQVPARVPPRATGRSAPRRAQLPRAALCLWRRQPGRRRRRGGGDHLLPRPRLPALPHARTQRRHTHWRGDAGGHGGGVVRCDERGKRDIHASHLARLHLMGVSGALETGLKAGWGRACGRTACAARPGVLSAPAEVEPRRALWGLRAAHCALWCCCCWRDGTQGQRGAADSTLLACGGVRPACRWLASRGWYSVTMPMEGVDKASFVLTDEQGGNVYGAAVGGALMLDNRNAVVSVVRRASRVARREKQTGARASAWCMRLHVRLTDTLRASCGRRLVHLAPS